MNEIETIKKCQSGDEAAFSTLISFYYPHVVRFLSGFQAPSELREDITQETFLKLIRNIDKYHIYGKAKFSTYLFSIAKNCLIDELRKKKWTHIDIEVLVDLLIAEESPEDATIKKMNDRELEQAISSLSPVQQTAIRLKYFEGLSLKEIGERTGAAENAVKGRLHRGISKLKDTLIKGDQPYEQ